LSRIWNYDVKWKKNVWQKQSVCAAKKQRIEGLAWIICIRLGGRVITDQKWKGALFVTSRNIRSLTGKIAFYIEMSFVSP
jgi:hypothetical protein